MATYFYIFPNVHSAVSVEMYQFSISYQAGSDRHRDRVEIPNNPIEERSSAAPAVRQPRQLTHLALSSSNTISARGFSIRNAEAAIYNVFVCLDLVPQQLGTLYVF